MGLENWEQERSELQAVLDQISSGQIILKNGREDYIASLKWRLRQLDEKLNGTRRD